MTARMHYATTIRNPWSGSRRPALILRPRPVSRRQAPCHSSSSPSPAIVADISVARPPKVPRSETIQQVHVHASVAADANAPDLARTDKPIISARDVVKRYGETIAVAGLDLTIWPGEIFGILGPNGAGKTTTLEMLEGLRAPDAGEMRVAGFDPVTDPEQGASGHRRPTAIDRAFRLPELRRDHCALCRTLRRRCLSAAGRTPAHAGRARGEAPLAHQHALRGPAAAVGHRPGARQYAADRVPRRADDRDSIRPPGAPSGRRSATSVPKRRPSS